MINDVRWPLTNIMCISPEGKHQLLAQMLSSHEKFTDVNWMIAHFKSVCDGNQVQTVITDRAQIYGEVIKARFPNAKHIYCIHHIKANIRRKCKELGLSERSDEIEKLFISSVYASSKHEFDERRRRLYDTILNPLSENADDPEQGADMSTSSAPVDNREEGHHTVTDRSHKRQSQRQGRDKRSSTRVAAAINIHEFSDGEDDEAVVAPSEDPDYKFDDDPQEEFKRRGPFSSRPDWWLIFISQANQSKPEVLLVNYLCQLFQQKDHFAGYITSDFMTCGAWSTQAVESLHHAIKYSSLRDLKRCTLARIVELIGNFIARSARKHSWVGPSDETLRRAKAALTKDMQYDIAPFVEMVRTTCNNVVSNWIVVESVEAYRFIAAKCATLQDVKGHRKFLPTRLQEWLDECTADPVKSAQCMWFLVRPVTRPNQRPRVLCFNTATGAFRCACHRPTRNGYTCRHLVSAALSHQEVYMLPQHIHDRYWREDCSTLFSQKQVVTMHKRAPVTQSEPCTSYVGNYSLKQRFAPVRAAGRVPTWTGKDTQTEDFRMLEKRDSNKPSEHRRERKQTQPYIKFQKSNDMRGKKSLTSSQQEPGEAQQQQDDNDSLSPDDETMSLDVCEVTTKSSRKSTQQSRRLSDKPTRTSRKDDSADHEGAGPVPQPSPGSVSDDQNVDRDKSQGRETGEGSTIQGGLQRAPSRRQSGKQKGEQSHFSRAQNAANDASGTDDEREGDVDDLIDDDAEDSNVNSDDDSDAVFACDSTEEFSDKENCSDDEHAGTDKDYRAPSAARKRRAETATDAETRTGERPKRLNAVRVFEDYVFHA